VQVGPPGACWKGVLTLPRVLDLRADGRLGIEPLPELARLRGSHRRREDVLVAEGAPAALVDLPSDTIEIRAELELGSAREVGLTIPRFSRGGSPVTVTYDHRAGRLGCAGRSGEFRHLAGTSPLRLRIFLDRSVVEVYAGGRAALTAGLESAQVGELVLAGEGDRTLTLFARGGEARAAAVDVWEMASIWGARAA
jgi:sucrose-6-phosphate hydrolase SacC (GH32 family)